MQLPRATARVLICWCLMSPSQTRAQPTLSIRPALLQLPHVKNESAEPVQFKRAPLNVVLHQFILLPGWVKEKEFDDLRDWLTEQGFMIVRANGAEPWRS